MKHANSKTMRVSEIIIFSFVMGLQGLTAESGAAQTRVSLQPFAQQVRQVENALAYLGQPLTQSDHEAVNAAIAEADESSAVASLVQILDKYTLAVVEINPESRVKVQPARRRLSWSRRERASF